MPSTNGDLRVLGPDGQPFRRFGYDAVEEKSRRRPPRVRLVSEDRELNTADRKKLVATGRDLPRNFAIAAWLCRMHTANVADFAFQARTGDAGLDDQLEQLVGWWSRAENFDVGGRHSLGRLMRIIEVRRLLDGDVFVLKLSSGRVQLIEGDRIRNPSGADLELGADRLIHGVRVSKGGRARAYCLHNRRPNGEGFEFDRMIPARHMIGHGYFTRGDQVRGVSPMAAAINTLQDLYECFSYAVLKAKVSQIFGALVKRDDEDAEALGDITTSTDDTGNLDKSATTVDLGRGPFMMDVGPNDDLAIIESQQPSQQLQDFLRLLVAISMKAVDLPYSWFDQRAASWSSNRAEWVLYDKSAEPKREENRELLNGLLAWRIGLWVLDGVLRLPPSVSVDELAWSWVAKRMPWTDPQKEAQGWSTAISEKLTSRQRICLARGENWFDIADELRAEEEYLGQSPLPIAEQAQQRRRYAHLARLKDYRHALPTVAS